MATETGEPSERFDPVRKHITELSSERATPEGMAGRLMESEHRARYAWAGQLAEGREVLDAGCGSGYGTEILAAVGAQRVVGIDISDDAIEYARSAFAATSREFRQADIHQLPFEDGTFDLVACFEVIEHVDRQRDAIEELRRVLRPDGVLAISSPNRDVYPTGNPYHTHEFTPGELAEVLASEFSEVRLYRESPWLAAAILDDEQSRASGEDAELRLRAIKIAAVEPGNELFTVALASNAELPEPEALLLMGTPFEVQWWEKQLSDAMSTISERDRQREQYISECDRQREDQGRVLLAIETKLANSENELAQLRAAYADLQKWTTERITEAEELEHRLRRAEGTIGDITGSLSWRITSPLRSAKRLFSG